MSFRACVRSSKRGQLGLQPIGKPLGSVLSLGPTRAEKTELTIEFNRHLFGGDPVFHFDMSEFPHLDNVKLFMGDKTGNPGCLGNVLSQYQQGVLLFDEIEKAHHLIWDLFLQMLVPSALCSPTIAPTIFPISTSAAQATSASTAAFASDPVAVHDLGAGRSLRAS